MKGNRFSNLIVLACSDLASLGFRFMVPYLIIITIFARFEFLNIVLK